MYYEKTLKICGLKLTYKAKLFSLEKLLVNEPSTIRDKCKVCRNYGNNYACPPLAPTTTFLRNKFRKILVYILHAKDGNLDDWNMLAKIIHYYGLKVEKELDGLCLIAGECKICEKCAAESFKPCIYPEKKRYSITGIGLDVEKTFLALNHKLSWKKSELTAIGGCLTNKNTVNHNNLINFFKQEINKLSLGKS